MSLSDDEQMRKDVSYSPASETETAAKQDQPRLAVEDPDIDPDAVIVAPGTGGPDDFGEVAVNPREICPPRDPDTAH